jgi:acyl carrier protein
MRKVVAITIAVVGSVSVGRQLTGHEDFGPGLALVQEGLASDAAAAIEATEIAVRELLAEEWGADPGQLSVRATLSQELKIDSIDRIKLIKDVEDKFNIEISSKEAVQLVTVGDIVRLVARKTAAR